MESWENARFQAKSHETEKSEGATYGQDITPAILNGFGDKEIFHDTAKRLCHGRMKAAHFFKTAKDKTERIIFDNINQMVEESITRIANKK